MPAVFVHGVPETAALWDGVRAALGPSESTAVALPGFGVPLPDGFGATKEEYLDWLIGEVENVGEPVDLVGHDWGGLLTLRLASVRPDLVHTWVSDAVVLREGYVWHPTAQVWQTPGAGEALMDQLGAMAPEERAAAFTAIGVPADDAVMMCRAMDATMRSCILTLYRSAVDIGDEWAPALDGVKAPGLVVYAPEDPFHGGPESAEQLAQRTHARVAERPGAGHWWMLQDPPGAAAMLEEFWGA